MKRTGLVEWFGDQRDQTYMVWLHERLKGSRVGARMVHVVEGMLASRGLWRW